MEREPMGTRDLVKKIFAPIVKAIEGEYRNGPYWLPITQAWLPDGAPLNWWQCGGDPLFATAQSAIVEACISAYSQTIAMCPGEHWRSNSKGGRDRVTTSSLARVLRKPNDYQSMSDFMLNATRSLYLEGNAYALALRNDRYEITELHLMNPALSRPQIAADGSIFYRLQGNAIVDLRFSAEALLVPARDVLHIRLHASKRYPHPLIGETPLLAALADISTSSAITSQQFQFYQNQARPSAVLSTDLVLDKDQVQALRDRWNEQSRGMGQGNTPILTAGLKVQPWNVGGRDAEIANVMKFTDQHIALAFRVPLQILGIGGTTYSSTELLMQSWIATGLGFALNHVEEAFGMLFSLKGQPDEYIEFDTSALLRSATKDRIDALVRGVQGGVYSPNEARALEGYDAVEHGEEPRLQAQVVPLSVAGAIPTAPAASAAPASQGSPTETPSPSPPKKEISKDDIKREAARIRATANRIGRRYFN
jgi:HK97 family phage portal protein